MRLATGKRIGQTGQELIPAVLFSTFLHVLAFLTAFFLYVHVAPRAFVPPSYRVTLVRAPADLARQPAPPAEEPVKAPERAPVSKPKVAPKDAMPELKKQKAATPESEYVVEDKPKAVTKPDVKSSGVVALSTPQEVKFSPYMEIVREKIVRHWNPPPGAKETKATVTFRVSRFGRVMGADLRQPSGNFYFDQAAMRAILSSSPFPPLPDGYFQEAMDFSVDLMASE